MTGDLVPRGDVDSWAAILGPVGDLASKIANTEFAPKSLRGRAPAVAAAILAGRERGLPPMVSLASIDVVDGRPTLSAQLLAALVYRAGHRITIIESSDRAAEVKIERADGLGEATVRWTIADAQKAGLAGKRNWQQYARQMLYARALSECARMACPDVALGLDVDSAPVDNEPPKAPTVVQLAPKLEDFSGVSKVKVGRVAEETRSENSQDDDTSNALQERDQPTIEEAVLVDSEPLITPAQMRKIGALIGQWETAREQKLDRDERRHFIGELAGVEDLGSAKDLTRDQASAAIDALATMLAGESQGEEPSP